MTEPMHPPLFGNAVNLGGLYSATPLRVVYDPETRKYWDSEGNFEVERVGTFRSSGYIGFASEKITDVEAWTQGAKAAMAMIHSWSRP